VISGRISSMARRDPPRRIHALSLAVLGLALVALAVGFAQHAVAEPAYVVDELRITLRSGPGEGYRVLEALPTGTALELGRRQGEWAEVTTPAGRSGWVLERYLQREGPARNLLPRLREQLEQAQGRAGTLEGEVQRLVDQLASLEQVRERNLALEATNARLSRSSGALQLATGAAIALVGVLIGALWARARGSRPLTVARRRIKL